MCSEKLRVLKAWIDGEISIFSHLNERDMSYSEHMSESLKYSKTFFIHSLKACVHAVVPSLYTTSSSDFVNKCKEINIETIPLNKND